ncbi:site-specific DNA-methyltransferase [Salinisphaera sp. P385]|uniref:site-specific DNA-methyltransferase (adenine-specific) n=1 Tax=Spectribacter acetivorans TaxID=3075603 RepID=A0ABU3B924_9GAMM|nr:site-specific DNA-methyltransferase [Salinisphaera sp. P385]MDT0618302.1 site-specific DNA-methyltransferase [Salinisphaera sp. P385]
MPELVFKGKEYVYNHHLSVPYRPLEAVTDKSVGLGDLNGNLIIHGDNLHALKALLPRYAGQVDLVFIDPPYNTGNEGWCYNDNVNSPIMREWLSSNPVDGEDMLRHDKWLCMMWPRLVLLRELLSDRGSLWMTLDDNELHRARMILDEIFGEDNFVANVIWQKNYSPKNSAQYFSEDHDHLVVVTKDRETWRPNMLKRSEAMESRYSNPDNDPRGPWKAENLSARNAYRDGIYAIRCPGGRIIEGPPKGRYWVVNEETFKKWDTDGRIWWGKDGNNTPAIKRFLSEVKQGRVPQTLWFYDEVGHTQDAKRTLLEMGVIQSQQDATLTPKPVSLIKRVIEIATDPDSIVLDSFAGSATTGHAVLSANEQDGGERKFVLVECEDYADSITAERVRRAINGYAFSGTKRETLLEEKLTFSKLKKVDDLMERVEAIKAREGFGSGDLADQASVEKKRFSEVKATVKDGRLMVEGVKKISERVEGLGGEFTFCTLGEALDLEKMLSGEALPDYESLGAWLYHTATGETLPARPKKAPQWYLGEAEDKHLWLIYQPSLLFLKSPEAALTLSVARDLQGWSQKHGGNRKNLVFAPAKYLSNRQLQEHGVEYAPLPFALYREA